MPVFKKRFRSGTARVSWWDYGSNGAYFVTICTKDRIHHFGKIENGIMILSPLGLAAKACWNEIPKHFPFVKLGSFVVMPDHVHGIIIIDKPPAEDCQREIEEFKIEPMKSEIIKNKFGPQSKNLASIIRGFKIGVTKYSKMINPKFSWQRLYHERIIRSETDYFFVDRYIMSNPENQGRHKIDE